MAATYTELADGSSVASSASVTTASTVTATVTDNDWLVVFIGAANSGVSGSSSVTGVTDSSGNVYTARINTVYTPGNVVDDGITLAVFTAPVTSAITNGTVTVSFSPNTPEKAVTVVRARPGSGETMSFIGSGTGAGANATSFTTGNVSVTSGDTIFGVLALESNDLATGDSDTTNGSWSSGIFAAALNATDATSAQILTQYKTVSATGNQNATSTIPTPQDGKPGHIILRSAVAALSLFALSGVYALTGTNATLTHGYRMVAGAGSYALTGTNATLKRARLVQPASGIYRYIGSDVALTKSGLVNKTLVAGAGSYALTGNANLVLVRTITLPGEYLLTGTTATLTLHTLQTGSADGRGPIERVGEGYSEENAKEDRRNRWEVEQFRLKLDAMYEGREYVEQPFPEDITPAQRAAAAAQAAAERAAMFQAMLTEQQARQRAALIAQQFAMRQAQDEEDAATIAVMGD